MKNALLMGMEFQRMLPACETPEHTEGYEGFYHLDQFEGTVEKAEMIYIIRDHDRAKFEKRKERAVKICDYLNELYGVGSFEYVLSDSYYNMKEKIEPHIHLVRNVEKAMKDVGIEPKVTAIRGGTDGARLSYMGLPCPNICTADGQGADPRKLRLWIPGDSAVFHISAVGAVIEKPLFLCKFPVAGESPGNIIDFQVPAGTNIV